MLSILTTTVLVLLILFLLILLRIFFPINVNGNCMLVFQADMHVWLNHQFPLGLVVVYMRDMSLQGGQLCPIAGEAVLSSGKITYPQDSIEWPQSCPGDLGSVGPLWYREC